MHCRFRRAERSRTDRRTDARRDVRADVPRDERRALAILRRVHFLLVELANVLPVPHLHARRRQLAGARRSGAAFGSRGAMPKKSVLPSSDHCGARYAATRSAFGKPLSRGEIVDRASTACAATPRHAITV